MEYIAIFFEGLGRAELNETNCLICHVGLIPYISDHILGDISQ